MYVSNVYKVWVINGVGYYYSCLTTQTESSFKQLLVDPYTVLQITRTSMLNDEQAF